MSFIHTNFKNFSVHTYTAPETGYLVNSQIIETKKHLVIIDTQFLIKSAEEVFNFAKKIGKPIARVINTHAHPDHWFGNSIFANCEIFALPQVKKDMEKDAVTAFERNKPHLGDLIGDKAVLPNKILENNFSIDGVNFKVFESKNTEANLIALIEIENEKILFASDLVYGKIHLYIAENHIDEWIKELKNLQKKNYKFVFAGHGAVNASESLEKTEKYLECANAERKKSKTFEEFEKKMLKNYPNHDGKTLLHANGMFLKF